MLREAIDIVNHAFYEDKERENYKRYLRQEEFLRNPKFILKHRMGSHSLKQTEATLLPVSPYSERKQSKNLLSMMLRNLGLKRKENSYPKPLLLLIK